MWFYTLSSPLFSPPLPPPPQDGYEHACAHTEHGNEFVKKAASFVEKLIHVEQNYAKELRYVCVQCGWGRDGEEGGRRR